MESHGSFRAGSHYSNTAALYATHQNQRQSGKQQPKRKLDLAKLIEEAHPLKSDWDNLAYGLLKKAPEGALAAVSAIKKENANASVFEKFCAMLEKWQDVDPDNCTVECFFKLLKNKAYLDTLKERQRKIGDEYCLEDDEQSSIAVDGRVLPDIEILLEHLKGMSCDAVFALGIQLIGIKEIRNIQKNHRYDSSQWLREVLKKWQEIKPNGNLDTLVAALRKSSVSMNQYADILDEKFPHSAGPSPVQKKCRKRKVGESGLLSQAQSAATKGDSTGGLLPTSSHQYEAKIEELRHQLDSVRNNTVPNEKYKKLHLQYQDLQTLHRRNQDEKIKQQETIGALQRQLHKQQYEQQKKIDDLEEKVVNFNESNTRLLEANQQLVRELEGTKQGPTVSAGAVEPVKIVPLSQQPEMARFYNHPGAASVISGDEIFTLIQSGRCLDEIWETVAEELGLEKYQIGAISRDTQSCSDALRKVFTTLATRGKLGTYRDVMETANRACSKRGNSAKTKLFCERLIQEMNKLN